MKSRSKRINRVDDVAAWRLCMGCGACKWGCPEGAIELHDIIKVGIRPVIDEHKCQKCNSCLEVCPGWNLEKPLEREGSVCSLQSVWGNVLELYEGHALDEQIQFKGSSGGAATAIALFALEKMGYKGVLHIKPNPDNPLKNIPTFSTCRSELVQGVGSRYAPAAPCQAFDWIKEAGGPCLFIGKPCDVAALEKARKLDCDLDRNVALTISIFCAGTPTTAGTHALLHQMGVDDKNNIQSFRYRGHGWPGVAQAILKDGSMSSSLTYAEAWGGVLCKKGQLRCRLCPDHTGMYADLSCGDPWHNPPQEKELGRSLVLARTQMGLEILSNVANADYIKLEVSKSESLPQSQKSLTDNYGQLWGRLWSFQFLCIPIPSYFRFELVKPWKESSWIKRAKVIGATLKRILARQWYTPSKRTGNHV